MRNIILGIAAFVALSIGAMAQTYGPGPTNPPCAVFGTTAGTCFQGNGLALTGPITSSGNATSIASQTGTGAIFVTGAGTVILGRGAATDVILAGTNNINQLNRLSVTDGAAIGTGFSTDLALISDGGGSYSASLEFHSASTNYKSVTLNNSGGVALPNLPTSSVAQTGTVCSGAGGALSVDTTTTCLLSLPELKDIHGRIGIFEALSDELRLQPIWFSWKHTTLEWQGDKAIQAGLNAREVEKVDTRLVAYSPDGKLRGVRYQELAAFDLAAIKSLFLFAAFIFFIQLLTLFFVIAKFRKGRA